MRKLVGWTIGVLSLGAFIAVVGCEQSHGDGAPVPETKVVMIRAVSGTGGASGLSSWIDQHVPKSITDDLSNVSTAFGYASSAKSAYQAIESFLQIVGVISPDPDIASLIGQVEADIAIVNKDITWETQTIQWATLTGEVSGPLSVAQDDINMNGNTGQTECPLPDTRGCGTHDALGAFATLKGEYNVLFGRPYDAPATAGTWTSVLAATRGDWGRPTSALTPPMIPGTNFVFDWRVGLPATLSFVNQFVQLYPLMDPNYQNDNTFDTGMNNLQDIRQWLEGIYTTIVSGVHADYMCNLSFSPGDPRDPNHGGGTNQPFYCNGNTPFPIISDNGVTITPETAVSNSWSWWAHVIAADINTGIQAETYLDGSGAPLSCFQGYVEKFHSPQGNVTATMHYIVPTVSCLNDEMNYLKVLVYSKLPLVDLRKVIDSLASMQGAGVPDESGLMPPGYITNCQAVADAYGIVQGSTFGSADPNTQMLWQMSGCYARASWLDIPLQVASQRALDYTGDGLPDFAEYDAEFYSGWRPLSGNAVGLPGLPATEPANGPTIPSVGGGFGGTGRYLTATTLSAVQFGLSGDVPVPGYYDWGAALLNAVWRPSSGDWYMLDSNGNQQVFQWGTWGDVPVPGDYDGDGFDDLAVFRPSDNAWYLNCSGYSPMTFGNVQSVYGLGQAGDIPVPRDYDGDGITDPGVWRPSTGTFYFRGSVNGQDYQVQWGQAGDIPVPADYDGDGEPNIAVFRPSQGYWYILSQDWTYTWAVIGWGQSGDIPVPGDYDGDGYTDYGIFRPSDGTWQIGYLYGGSTVVRSGSTGSIPIP